MPEATVQRLLEEFEAIEKRGEEKGVKPFFTLVRFIAWKSKTYKIGIARDSKYNFTIRITRDRGGSLR